MITSIEDIQNLIRAGNTDWQQYGDVRSLYFEDFVLLNYSAKAQYAGRWNWFELNSRGLILNTKTGEVVALPFPKFFNWGELDRTTDAAIHYITEKIDGSLGILYRAADGYRIATRGAFESEQALWATHYLKQHFSLDGLADELTLLFEIIYPGNRIVVNYGDKQDLVLIGARNRVTGQTLDLDQLKLLAQQFSFNMPTIYDFASIEDIITASNQLTADNEGWVVTFEDGSRFKFKGAIYQLAHKMLTGVSFKQVLEAVASGQFDALIEGVPDEFLTVIREYKQRIDTRAAEVIAFVEHEMQSAPRESRREFAQWVQGRYKGIIRTAYFFAALDGKSLMPLIYQHEFE